MSTCQKQTIIVIQFLNLENMETPLQITNKYCDAYGTPFDYELIYIPVNDNDIEKVKLVLQTMYENLCTVLLVKTTGMNKYIETFLKDTIDFPKVLYIDNTFDGESVDDHFLNVNNRDILKIYNLLEYPYLKT